MQIWMAKHAFLVFSFGSVENPRPLVPSSLAHSMSQQTSTATSGPTRPNGWISIHVVGNLTSVDGIPTIRWKSIQRMKIPSGIGWISHHVPQNGWMEIQPSLSHMAKLGGRGQKDVSNLLNLS